MANYKIMQIAQDDLKSIVAHIPYMGPVPLAWRITRWKFIVCFTENRISPTSECEYRMSSSMLADPCFHFLEQIRKFNDIVILYVMTYFNRQLLTVDMGGRISITEHGKPKFVVFD